MFSSLFSKTLNIYLKKMKNEKSYKYKKKMHIN